MFSLIEKHKQTQNDHIQDTLNQVSLECVEQSLIESLLSIQSFTSYHLNNDYHLAQELIDHTIKLHCAMVQYNEKEFQSLGLRVRLNHNVLSVSEIN